MLVVVGRCFPIVRTTRRRCGPRLAQRPCVYMLSLHGSAAVQWKPSECPFLTLNSTSNIHTPRRVVCLRDGSRVEAAWAAVASTGSCVWWPVEGVPSSLAPTRQRPANVFSSLPLRCLEGLDSSELPRTTDCAVQTRLLLGVKVAPAPSVVRWFAEGLPPQRGWTGWPLRLVLPFEQRESSQFVAQASVARLKRSSYVLGTEAWDDLSPLGSSCVSRARPHQCTLSGYHRDSSTLVGMC